MVRSANNFIIIYDFKGLNLTPSTFLILCEIFNFQAYHFSQIFLLNKSKMNFFLNLTKNKLSKHYKQT